MDNKSVENNYESKLHAHSVLFQQVTKDAKAEALFNMLKEPKPTNGLVVSHKVILQSMDQQSSKLEKLQAIKEPDCEKAYEKYIKNQDKFNLLREPFNPINDDFRNKSNHLGFE